MTYNDLETAIQAQHLNILGGFHPNADDQTPEGCQTLLLLGPDEPAFWPAFTQDNEWQDGTPDPMDRWSTRVIGALARQLGAQALFPFGAEVRRSSRSTHGRCARAACTPRRSNSLSMTQRA